VAQHQECAICRDRPLILCCGGQLEPEGRPRSARLLAVLRVPPGPVCTLGYIDRAANPDANALAGKAADEPARTFRCGATEIHIVGERDEAINARSPPTPNSTP